MINNVQIIEKRPGFYIANLNKNSLKSPNLTLLIDTIKEISENTIISVKYFNIED